jgi:hypothetical protein
MKIQHVTNINFREYPEEGRKRFVTSEIKNGAQNLLKMMNHGTVYKENKERTSWESEILASIGLEDNKIKFVDNRMYVAPVEKAIEDVTDCTLIIGKNRIQFNSTTGEVDSYKLSWLSTWRSVISKAETYIKTFQQFFDNPEIVTKNTFGIKGYTPKGLEIIQKRI